MNKDQAYHQIALACLKALRDPANVTANNPADVLYQTIDKAFTEQYSLLMTELEDYHTRLKAISELDTDQHTLADAQRLATTTSRLH